MEAQVQLRPKLHHFTHEGKNEMDEEMDFCQLKLLEEAKWCGIGLSWILVATLASYSAYKAKCYAMSNTSIGRVNGIGRKMIFIPF